ncbi:hypothetical protein ACIA8I_40910 [Streptomyces rishiriensis]|uniref:hypothetical protein n=1 Tax=Streptomyces rishiriensis TaxID=68264 RepID=UPI0037BA6A64
MLTLHLEVRMPRIVGVHGIGQQLQGPSLLHDTWFPAMQDGLVLAGMNPLVKSDLRCAFYGDLFRRRGKMAGQPPYTAVDVEDGFEQELLELWWKHAADIDPQVPRPEEPTKIRAPQAVQRALNALCSSRFFAGFTERLLIGDLKQVHLYLANHKIRAAVRERINEAMDEVTELLVGHSLGSVAAYEVLCGHPAPPVRALITLGSPLAISNLIFNRLEPAPTDGKGAWPSGVEHWTNISDRGDVVALVKDLSSVFGPRVADVRIHNGARAHDIRPYLTAKETGNAIAASLA